MSVSNFLGIAAANISAINGIATSNISNIKGIVWSSGGANPQLQFFENFPVHYGQAFLNKSIATLSVHAVNIPLSLSFNSPLILLSHSDDGINLGTRSFSFGLYSLTGSTLSLANSASGEFDVPLVASNFNSWHSMVTSATQNITPGAWYFALNFQTSGVNANNFSFYGNSTAAPVNAIPGKLVMGRMTVSTGAMPASIATSELDVTNSDAIRQPYILLTA